MGYGHAEPVTRYTFGMFLSLTRDDVAAEAMRQSRARPAMSGWASST